MRYGHMIFIHIRTQFGGSADVTKASKKVTGNSILFIKEIWITLITKIEQYRSNRTSGVCEPPYV